MPDKITSTRLAAICGVSQGTVDRALNGRPGIKEETRRRILQKAEELGYVKDMRASGLVRGASWLIGLVLFDLRNEYFAQLASAVEARARALGYTVVLLLTDRDPARERDSVRRLCGLGADGILLCPAGRGEAYEQWLRGLRVPLVTVGNRLSGFPHAGVWEEAAMGDAVRYAAGRDYRRLVYVYTAKEQESRVNIDAQRRRYEGFRSAAAALPRLETHVVAQPDYIPAVRALIGASTARTALLFPSDYQALHMLLALREEGVPVPARVGVMGFDDIDMLRYLSERLTTVGCSIDRISADAVDAVVHGTPPPVLPHKIIPGATL